MKRYPWLFLLLLPGFSPLAAQTIYFTDDAAFTRGGADSSKASAVILAQRTEMTYALATATRDMYAERSRRRVLLNDKASIAGFSEYYFLAPLEASRTPNTDYGLSIQIVKPDGTIINVSTAAAVPVEGDNVPQFFRARRGATAYIYHKLAVPGLEPGDIIDISDLKTEYYPHGKNSAFPGYYISMSSSYPIRYQRFDLKYDAGYSINTISLNGAPSFSEPETLTEKTPVGGTKKMFRLSITDLNRASVEEERWQSTLTDLPHIKLQVVSVKSPEPGKSGYWAGAKGTVKRSVTTEELALAFSKRVLRLDPALTYIKTEVMADCHHHTFLDHKGEADRIYYSFRAHYMDYKYDHGGSRWRDFFVVEDEAYIQLMTYMLKHRKVPYEVILYAGEETGSLDKAMLDNELHMAILVDGKIYYPFGLHTSAGQIGSDIPAASGIAFTPATSPKKLNLHGFSFPQQKTEDNAIVADISLALDTAGKTTETRIRTAYTGLFKRDYANRMLKNSKYEQFPVNDNDVSVQSQSVYGYGATTEYSRLKSQLETELQKAIERERKEDVQGDYDVDEYLGYTVEKRGRYGTSDSMICIDRFTVRSLLTPVGKRGYMLDAGTLIGGQLELSQDDKTRKTPAHMDYERVIINHIHIRLPDGYTVAGIENLNMDVSNGIGRFVTTAHQDKNMLIIDTRKEYMHPDIAVADWPQLIAFVDAAWNFQQRRVLLQKVN